MKLNCLASIISPQSLFTESICAGAVLLIAATMNAQAQYNYTAFSVPGAVDTDAAGISGNDIVGSYSTSGTLPWQGFLYNGSSYTTLSVPGASTTYAEGISGNDIVGYYYGASGGGEGFLATPVPEPSVPAMVAVGLIALLETKFKHLNSWS